MSELATAAELVARQTPPESIAPPVDFIDPNSWSPTEGEIAAEMFRTGNQARESLIASLKADWRELVARLEKTNPAAIQEILRAKRAAALADQAARDLAESSRDAVDGISAGCIAYARIIFKRKLLGSLAITPETRQDLGNRAVNEFLNYATADFAHGWQSCRAILEEISHREAIEPFIGARFQELDAEAAVMRDTVRSEAEAAGIKIADVLALMNREMALRGSHPRYEDFGKLRANSAFTGLAE